MLQRNIDTVNAANGTGGIPSVIILSTKGTLISVSLKGSATHYFNYGKTLDLLLCQVADQLYTIPMTI